MKLSKELKVGLLVLTAISVFYIGFNFLKGVNLFTPAYYYYTSFANVKGLAQSAPVFCNGYKIGLVQKILFDKSNPTNPVVVEIRLEENVNIFKNSVIELTTAMLGEPSLTLLMDSIDRSECYVPGDTLPSVESFDLFESIASELLPSISRLVATTDSTILSVHQVIENNKKELHQTLVSIENLASSLERSGHSLEIMMNNKIPATIDNINALSGNLGVMSEKMKKIEFEQIGKDIEQTLDTLKLISGQLSKKDNTLGLLLNDRLLYQNLNNAVGSADSLLIDIKKNPKRYINISVFGGKK